MISDNTTPRERAFQLAINALRVFYDEHARNEVEGSPSYQKAVANQLAKLHNDLLSKSGLDGLELEKL